ncbi:hypothetical protein T484DRAFT_1916326, partial [Baffinella frigidus]
MGQRGGGPAGGGGTRPDPDVVSMIEFMSSIGAMSLQVDSGDLGRALHRMSYRIKQFLKDDSVQSVLIHNRAAEGLSVWIEAPHGAEMSNSFSFSKKDGMKPNPSFWGLSLTTMSGVPDGMKALSEEETAAALKSNDASTPLESPTPHTPQTGYPGQMPNYPQYAMFDPNAASFPAPPPAMVERAKESIPVPPKAVPIKKKEKPAGPEFQGTWADDDEDDGEEGGALVLDIVLPPPPPDAPPAWGGGDLHAGGAGARARGHDAGAQGAGRGDRPGQDRQPGAGGGERRRGRDRSDDAPGGGGGLRAGWGDQRGSSGDHQAARGGGRGGGGGGGG